MPSLLREMRLLTYFLYTRHCWISFNRSNLQPLPGPRLNLWPLRGARWTFPLPLCSPVILLASPRPVSVLPVMEYSPVPIPLTTAPSTSPVVTALFVGALWGARLGKNRQLLNTRTVITYIDFHKPQCQFNTNKTWLRRTYHQHMCFVTLCSKEKQELILKIAHCESKLSVAQRALAVYAFGVKAQSCPCGSTA